MSRPQIAMVASEAVASDSRTRREALALVRAGFDVTLLTTGAGKDRTETRLGAVHIVRVPVRHTLRDGLRERRARRRARVPRIGYRDSLAERAARTRLQAAQLASESSGVPILTNALLTLRRQAIGMRAGAQQALHRAFTTAWRGFDATIEAVPTGASWRRRLPEVDDYEAVFGPELDQLQADALFVRELGLVGVAARACARARLAGRQVPWVYEVDVDLDDGAPEHPRSRRDQAALAALEREYVRYAAKVVSVNDAGAHGVQGRCRLLARPVVIPADDVSRLGDVYLELLDAHELEPRPQEPDNVRELPLLPDRLPYEGPLLGVGPANMAGQGWAWAKAFEQEVPGTRTEVLMVDRGSSLIFPADELVPAATYRGDRSWQKNTRERILSTWTHALIEAGRPLMGGINGLSFVGDARLMALAGIKVGLVFHGSELRDPRRHAAVHRWSPFQDTGDSWVQRVQETVDLLRPNIDSFTGPCLVSTPDLLEDLPRATWLPVVVDCKVWRPRPEHAEPSVPIVMHTPSRAAIKGSAFVDQALTPLVAERLVEYRRIERVPPQQMPAVLSEADIVLDQFAIASYGVLACQAMATGVAVVGHVSVGVRKAVEQSTGQALPIIEANPDNLQEVLRRLVAEPELRRSAAQAGPAFVRSVHDGKRSTRILTEALGIGDHV